MSNTGKRQKGVLYLIPNTLGGGGASYITESSRAAVAKTKTFLIEEIKSSRRLMRALGYEGDFQDIQFIMLNEHSKDNELMEGMQPLLQGENIGIISEAGLPCIADPGHNAVLLAHQLGVRVVPLSGPSSIFMALMASGLNGQSFSFIGYLPRERAERIKKLKQLESLALRNHTQLFMDAPYRNNQVLEDILANVKPDLQLCVATNISADNERITTRSVSDWAKNKPDLHKQPVMFVLGL